MRRAPRDPRAAQRDRALPLKRVFAVAGGVAQGSEHAAAADRLLKYLHTDQASPLWTAHGYQASSDLIRVATDH